MNNLQTIFPHQPLDQANRGADKHNHLMNSGRELPELPRPREGKMSPLEQARYLTPREREILQYVAEGKANKEAAYELSISIKTVEKHRENLMDKLGIRGTAGLTRYAIAAGIVELNF